MACRVSATLLCLGMKASGIGITERLDERASSQTCISIWKGGLADANQHSIMCLSFHLHAACEGILEISWDMGVSMLVSMASVCLGFDTTATFERLSGAGQACMSHTPSGPAFASLSLC